MSAVLPNLAKVAMVESCPKTGCLSVEGVSVCSWKLTHRTGKQEVPNIKVFFLCLVSFYSTARAKVDPVRKERLY